MNSSALRNDQPSQPWIIHCAVHLAPPPGHMEADVITPSVSTDNSECETTKMTKHKA